MTFDKLDQIWSDHIAKKELLGIVAREGHDGLQTIQIAGKIWERKSDKDTWSEVPPLKGHLSPQKTEN